MAAVKITINGVICDMYGRTISGPVKIVGEAMYSDRGVGGGPLPGGGGPVDPGYGYPETPVDPGYGIPEGRPPHIWGPTDPRPTPPIALPPGYPGAPPHVEHPIVLPPTLPDLPPPPEGATKPPPSDQGGWGYYDGRWGYFPGPGEPGPKR